MSRNTIVYSFGSITALVIVGMMFGTAGWLPDCYSYYDYHLYHGIPCPTTKVLTP